MKRFIAAGAVLLAAAAAHAQDQHVMKVALLGTANNPVNACGALGLAEEIAEKSGGRIALELYLGGTAFASPTKLYEQVERGVIDYTMAIASYTPGRFPLAELIGLPMLADDNVAMARAATELAPEYLADEFEGVHLLALPAVGAYQFHLRDRAESIEELDGRRILATGRVMNAALSEFGIRTVQLPATEQYENLQKGVIDGSLLPWAAVLAFKIDEVTSHHLSYDFITPPAILAMSEEFYGSLPDDLKQLVDEEMSGPDVAARISQCWQTLAVRAQEKTQESGNTITYATEEQRAALAEELAPVIDAFVGEVEAEGKPARAFVDALRAKLAENGS